MVNLIAVGGVMVGVAVLIVVVLEVIDVEDHERELAPGARTTSDLEHSEREEDSVAHHRDAWFNGYNQSLVTISWVGFDSNKKLGKGEVDAATFPARPVCGRCFTRRGATRS